MDIDTGSVANQGLPTSGSSIAEPKDDVEMQQRQMIATEDRRTVPGRWNVAQRLMSDIDAAKYRPEAPDELEMPSIIPPAPKLGEHHLLMPQGKIEELRVSFPDMVFDEPLEGRVSCNAKGVEKVLDNIFDVCFTRINDIDDSRQLDRMAFLVEMIIEELQFAHPWSEKENQFRKGVELFYNSIQALIVNCKRSGLIKASGTTTGRRAIPMSMRSSIARLCSNDGTGALPNPLEDPEVYSRNGQTPWLELHRDQIRRLLPHVRTWEMARSILNLRSEPDLSRMGNVTVRRNVTDSAFLMTTEQVQARFKNQVLAYLEDFETLATEANELRTQLLRHAKGDDFFRTDEMSIRILEGSVVTYMRRLGADPIEIMRVHGVMVRHVPLPPYEKTEQAQLAYGAHLLEVVGNIKYNLDSWRQRTRNDQNCNIDSNIKSMQTDIEATYHLESKEADVEGLRWTCRNLDAARVRTWGFLWRIQSRQSKGDFQKLQTKLETPVELS